VRARLTALVVRKIAVRAVVPVRMTAVRQQRRRVGNLPVHD